MNDDYLRSIYITEFFELSKLAIIKNLNIKLFNFNN